jgi:hypothetical protein
MMAYNLPNIVIAPTLEVGADLKWTLQALKDLVIWAAWVYDGRHVALVLPTSCGVHDALLQDNSIMEQAKIFSMSRKLSGWTQQHGLGATIEVYSRALPLITTKSEQGANVAARFLAEELISLYGTMRLVSGVAR